MPFIRTSTNLPISKEKELLLKSQLGEAIALIPGKSERSLMLEFCENRPMYLAGSDEPLVMAEVNVFSEPDPAACEDLTVRMTEIFNEVLAVSAGRVYIKYAWTDLWGAHGHNVSE